MGFSSLKSFSAAAHFRDQRVLAKLIPDRRPLGHREQVVAR
jgi:hypothetical protein